jgi:hypothetical protein
MLFRVSLSWRRVWLSQIIFVIIIFLLSYLSIVHYFNPFISFDELYKPDLYSVLESVQLYAGGYAPFVNGVTGADSVREFASIAAQHYNVLNGILSYYIIVNKSFIIINISLSFHILSSGILLSLIYSAIDPRNTVQFLFSRGHVGFARDTILALLLVNTLIALSGSSAYTALVGPFRLHVFARNFIIIYAILLVFTSHIPLLWALSGFSLAIVASLAFLSAFFVFALGSIVGPVVWLDIFSFVPLLMGYILSGWTTSLAASLLYSLAMLGIGFIALWRVSKH